MVQGGNSRIPIYSSTPSKFICADGRVKTSIVLMFTLSPITNKYVQFDRCFCFDDYHSRYW